MARNGSRSALFTLLVASLLLTALVFRPLWEAILLGAVLAAVLWPVHARLTRWFRGRDGMAAGTVVLGLVIVIAGPIAGLSAFVVQQTREAVVWLSSVLRSEGVEGLLSRLPTGMADTVRSAIGDAVDAPDLPSLLGVGEGAAAASALGATLSATGSLVFQTVMMLLALWFFLSSKESVIAWIDDASPLEEDQTRELLAEVRRVSVSVVRSTVLTAGVQTVAALIGYYIAGVPYPWFFTGITFFVALIPAIGAAAVCLATALILFLIGKTVGAIFLVIWGLVVVGLSDNLVKPLLMRHGVGMHPMVVLFSLLGGVAAFGAIGLVLGPLVVAVFLSVLRIYRRDYGGDGVPGGGPVGSSAAPATGPTNTGAEAPPPSTPRDGHG